MPFTKGIAGGIGSTEIADLLKQAKAEDFNDLMRQSLALWAQFSGLKVDGKEFDFDEYRYLLPIYLDDGQIVVWQKAAQLGATIYLLLRLLWLCRTSTLHAGLYFPTADGIENIAKGRLNPLIRSNKDLADNISSEVNTLGLKHIHNIEGQVSSLNMLYVGGTASKDSVPLDCIAFDEVRLIPPSFIDQCFERISGSKKKLQIYMSTCGQPNADINARFLQGSQMTWQINCGSPSSCPNGFNAAETFPNCIVDYKGEVYLRCPRCKNRIYDPQYGRYIARNPEADFNSYRVSQLVSKRMTPKIIWDFYGTTTNMQEFYKAKLGLPFIDEENRPVTDAVLDKCTNKDLQWAYQAPSRQKLIQSGTVMGVDQGKGYCYVVIMRRNRQNKKQILHVEFIESQNPNYWKTEKGSNIKAPVSPFVRCKELMKEFNVKCCVVDSMPNANEAMDFAHSFKGKVFTATYRDMGVDIVQWGDRNTDKAGSKKSSDKAKNRYQVTIGRYYSLDFMLREWVTGEIEMPDARIVRQIARDKKSGKFEPVAVGMLFREQVKSLVREEKILDELNYDGRRKYRWIHIGEDHFAHAMNYVNVAAERMKRVASFGFL